MSLNDLTLDELRKLSDRLTSLAVAGFRLEQDGLAPRFDLTPGMPIRITLGAAMPVATRPEFGDWLALQTQSTEAAPTPLPTSAPVESPPVLGEGIGGEPVSAEPSRSDDDGDPPQVAASSEAKAESGGGTVMAAAQPSAAPVPGSASALAAAASMPAPWTSAEDKTLVDTVVDLMVNRGVARKPAATEASKLLPGRTADACIYRAHTKLKDRINALISEAATIQAQTEVPEIPEAATVDPGQGDAAVGGKTPAAVQPNDLTAHLLGMTDKGGWSLQRDTDLLELSIAGWPAGDIALELRMQTSAIRPRFDALTGLHDDEATGKKVRRWTREQVLEALQSIAKARAA